MALDDVGGSGVAEDPLTFILLDKTLQSSFKLLCQAPNLAIKENWIIHLCSILNMQGDFLRGQISFDCFDSANGCG